ncbi:MAG: YebC/PmpR family DNA-binding transcriptional regulator [Gammaproteobacteria bacterium]|nr:YebC/PmpR family DNA-binding transcriptional regulator [Gammaproteobacteria bacterium]
MAGHSKWANIQHRKGAQDAKRGKIFTKFIREITVASRMGGSDMSSNPRLRLAVDKALGSNMSKDTIDRAVKRGAGELEDVVYDEIRYEGYGPNGVAIMVDCMTDNRNRSVAEVRHAFNKYGGNMGTEGSVAYIFTKLGILSYAPGKDEDAIMEAALEAEADDVESHDDGSIDVLTSADEFVNVKEAMIAAGFEPDNSDVTMKAATEVDLDLEQGIKMLRMLDVLEDLDDVQNVYSNANIPDEAMQA